MEYQHKQQASGEWAKNSLLFQLANIGSEVSRTIKWQEKGKVNIANNAFDRSLELFDLTISDAKNQHRLKEICRVRELWVDYYFGYNIYNTSSSMWQKYFLNYSIAANRK